jgi:hypothetical protein
MPIWSGSLIILGRMSSILNVLTKLVFDDLLVIQRQIYTVKKAFRHSRPQPGCHLPNSPWAGIMTSYKRRVW